MRVRSLRASNSALQAEVAIGEKDNGSVVTTTIRLDRRREDVQAAFAALDNLCLREAQVAVDEAVRNAERRRREEQERDRSVVPAHVRGVH